MSCGSWHDLRGAACGCVTCVGFHRHIEIYDRYNKSSAVAEMGDSLDAIDTGRKVGAVPLSVGGWVPI